MVEMRSRLALAALAALLCAAPLAAAPRWYESDASGMALREIVAARKGDFDRVLSVEKRGSTEYKTLWRAGAEEARWETDFDAAGKRTEERSYRGGALSERELYSAEGLVSRTETYVGGSLAQVLDMEYVGGRLKRIVAKDPAGKTLYVDGLSYGLKGALREIRRDFASGATSSSIFSGKDGSVAEERLIQDGVVTVWKYTPLGFMESEESFAGDERLAATTFTYADREKDSLPSLVVEEDFRAGKRSESGFDPSGRLLSERVYLRGALAKETSYRYDGGKLLLKTSSAGGIVESWAYAYDGAGALREERRERGGQLLMLVEWTGPEDRVETLYKDGEAFVRVSYSGGAKKKEEILSGGAVVRTREF